MAKTVGLTGGIATGKSTIAGFFRALGVPIVDADQVARELVEPGQPALAAIVETFGTDVLKGERLDREALGARVFGDAEARRKLNGILHPRIAMESGRQLMEAAKGDVPYVMYEAALLVENGMAKAFAALVVVTVSPETQLQRLMGRDASARADAEKRIASQMPLSEKEAAADFVLRNDGSLEEAKAAVAALHEKLLAHLAK